MYICIYSHPSCALNVHVFLPKKPLFLPGKNRRKGGKKGPETSEWDRCRDGDGKVVLGSKFWKRKHPGGQKFTGWWQLKYLLFSPPKIGEDEPILSNIFQRGWNHQLV